MSTARTWSVALTGLAGHMVEVEADLTSNTPGFVLIGLADRALGEAVSRVQNACVNSGLDLPRRRLTVNLSPASLPKSGSIFDVAVAVAAMATDGALEAGSIARTVHIGELGLDGRLRPVAGVLPAVRAAREAGFEHVVVPHANGVEARLVGGIRVTAAASLAEVAVLHGADLVPAPVNPVRAPAAPDEGEHEPELADVVGQREAVDALIVAAAGGHHMLFSGPPGAGKTMLARRITGILPPLDDEEALEVTSVRSLMGEPVTDLDRTRPFIAPHHGTSLAALVGGGSRAVRPGAIVRAHRGVLMLDEVSEFSRVALDALRQPLESGRIEVHRAEFTAAFPARFQLVMATNPCPCGMHGVAGEECICPPMTVRRYASRLSGPLRDRLDIEIHVSRVSASLATQSKRGEITTSDAQQRVITARERAAHRWKHTPWQLNSEVPGSVLRQGEHRLPAEARSPLDQALQRGLITLRGYDRVLRVAWSLADLDAVARPTLSHIGRALYLKKGFAA